MCVSYKPVPHTFAPPLALPVLPPVLPLTPPMNRASSSSCLRGSRDCSSSIPNTHTQWHLANTQTWDLHLFTKCVLHHVYSCSIQAQRANRQTFQGWVHKHQKQPPPLALACFANQLLQMVICKNWQWAGFSPSVLTVILVCLSLSLPHCLCLSFSLTLSISSSVSLYISLDLHMLSAFLHLGSISAESTFWHEVVPWLLYVCVSAGETGDTRV